MESGGRPLQSYPIFEKRPARALRHSYHVAIFEITAPEKDCAAALAELVWRT